MFKEKYGINPIYIALWASLYLFIAVPCYVIVFERVPLLFGILLIIENVVCYYVFDNSVLEDLMDALKDKKSVITLFSLSIAWSLIMFLGLIFYQLKLFIILCLLEMICFIGIRILISRKS